MSPTIHYVGSSSSKRSRQDMLDLLFDTVNFYGADLSRRSISLSGVCSYRDESRGTSCAIGRFYEDSEYDECIEGSTADDLFADSLLPRALRGFNRAFLRELQILHDSNSFWNVDVSMEPRDDGSVFAFSFGIGLSDAGEERVARLVERVNDGVFDGVE